MRRLLIACLAFAGCSADTVPLGARLTVSSSLDFGDVPIGPSKRIDLEITNVSAAPVKIDSIEAGAAFAGPLYAFNVVDRPKVIEAGATARMGVLFEAYAAMNDPVASSFSIVTEFGAAQVSVRGRGVEAVRYEPDH